MKACKEIQNLISSFIDNELDEQSRSLVIRHISNCKVCRTYYNDLKSISEILSEIPEEPLPEKFSDDLRFRLYLENSAHNSNSNYTGYNRDKNINREINMDSLEKKKFSNSNNSNLPFYRTRRFKYFSSLAAIFIVVVSGFLILTLNHNFSANKANKPNNIAMREEMNVNDANKDTDNDKKEQVSNESGEQPNLNKSGVSDNNKNSINALPKNKGIVDKNPNITGKERENNMLGSASTAITAENECKQLNANVLIEYNDLAKARTNIESLVSSYGGILNETKTQNEAVTQRSMVSTADSNAASDTVNFTFKIPENQYPAFVEAIKKTYGNDVNISEGIKEDITPKINSIQKNINDIEVRLSKEGSIQEAESLKKEQQRLEQEKSNLINEAKYIEVSVSISKK